MTLDDLANYKGEWVDAGDERLSRLRRLRLPPPSQAWATDEMLNILEACVPKWAPGADAGEPRAAPARSTGTSSSKPRSSPIADLYRYNADPNFVTVPLDGCCRRRTPHRSAARSIPTRASATGRRGTRAMRSGDTIVLSTGRSLGQHGAWVNSNLRRLWLRPHRARLRHHAAQPRRAVHARSARART